MAAQLLPQGSNVHLNASVAMKLLLSFPFASCLTQRKSEECDRRVKILPISVCCWTAWQVRRPLEGDRKQYLSAGITTADQCVCGVGISMRENPVNLFATIIPPSPGRNGHVGGGVYYV